MRCTPQNDVITNVHVDTNVADADSLVLAGFAGGVIAVPAGSSLTSIKYHVAATEDGTYVPMYSGGSQVSTTVAAGRAYALDGAIKGAAYLKLEGNADGKVDLHLISR
jgi:hypothetical protein